MTKPAPELGAAIERLYQAFSTVPKPHYIEGCPCCIDRKDVGTLLSKPLRALTPNELASYAASAFLTVGERADYLYFLPRILEVSATEPWCWPSPEVTARAIRTADSESWAVGQREALSGFLMAVIDAAILTKEYYCLDGWVCAIARIGFDVRPYLDRIAGCPEAVLAFFECNSDTLPRRVLSNAFWERPSQAHDLIVNWFYSDEIARIPFEAYGYRLA